MFDLHTVETKNVIKTLNSERSNETQLGGEHVTLLEVFFCTISMSHGCW